MGPLVLSRVRQLILKNQIIGNEVAREYPNGEWVDINAIAAIGELLVARADGSLAREESKDLEKYDSSEGTVPLGPTQMLPGAAHLMAENLPPMGELPELNTMAQTGLLDAIPTAADRTVILSSEDNQEPAPVEMDVASVAAQEEEEKTTVMSDVPEEDADKTRVSVEDEGRPVESNLSNDPIALAEEPVSSIQLFDSDANAKRIANESTVVFQRSDLVNTPGVSSSTLPGKNKQSLFDHIKKAAIVLGIVALAHEALFDESTPQAPQRWMPIRPSLPAFVQGQANPEEANQLYALAMRDYVLDNVVGYRAAADKLLKAAAKDTNHVKALAMLASSYLNLIDSSNKDDQYFSTITKIIDLSRAKKVDLPETVIADVEFYITVNRPEDAQGRINEYTKRNDKFGYELFYYLALAFYHRGDGQTAARYIREIPDNKAFSAKVFYLRGMIAEKLKDRESALKEYEKAIKMNPAHAKSRLRISEMFSEAGNLKGAAAHLSFLTEHTGLLAPKELARTYILHAQLNQLYDKPDHALGAIERAVKLDPSNHDYLLEYYTLRSRAGDTTTAEVKKAAQMYYFLSQGEKLLKTNRYHDALVQFLRAHEANPGSAAALIKIGDMFRLQNDIGNALANYRKATVQAPKNVEAWSKYIGILIQSYEWEDANKALTQFKSLPVSASAVDKAAGDMYAKQGLHAEAQTYYKKAMGRDTIDPDTYIAYAKSLMATKNFKEAPFFFALALRYDPLNLDAIVGTAKCVAATQSIDQAISLLQDELSKQSAARADLLSSIAEMNIQRGNWEEAQRFVDQAKSSDHEHAYAWKLQGQIHMNRENTDKSALSQALVAYQSYSERNPSDPSGYLERYNIYLKKLEFEKANEELDKVYLIYPRYPNLAFYRGFLYAVQGNHKRAAEEFQKELVNNPQSIRTLIALGKEQIELGVLQGAGGAQELFNKAMQVAPTNAEARQQAGYTAYLMKNYQAAIALYNSALSYDKANPLIYKRLGMAYREMNDTPGAVAAFRKYLEMEPDAPDRAQFERYK